MNRLAARLFGVWILVAVSGCSKSDVATSGPSPNEQGALFRVGSITVYQTDLDHHIDEQFGGRNDEVTREKAMAQLVGRAQLAQAAIDANLYNDPVVRAELARLLGMRLKETALFPRIQEQVSAISDDQLREIYDSQADRFRSEEEREVAVLWLNPGQDPSRVKMYEDKLKQAREWFFSRGGAVEPADKGFSTLAVDHSEHAATRYKGGVLGWVEREEGGTDWARVVSEIAFSIEGIGDVSKVITRPEGVFLVRLMDTALANRRSFDSVRAELLEEEKGRLRKALEAEFEEQVKEKNPLKKSLVM